MSDAITLATCTREVRHLGPHEDDTVVGCVIKWSDENVLSSYQAMDPSILYQNLGAGYFFMPEEQDDANE